jgi:hypothetical protein
VIFLNLILFKTNLKKINNLQEEIYGSILTFGGMSRETKMEHVEKLQLLLEKQRIMYTRLSLSDDPEAVEMKENLRKSVALMGFPPDTDMQVLFDSMNETIESLKKYLDD